MKEEENPKSKAAEREEEILRFWKENHIFEKSLEKPVSKGDFVFYDGPPFATGEPHYGHILAGTMKDAIPRYKTMQGYHVRRVWGWDCHGLPIENLIEKELNLGNKKDIEKYGIDKFNKAARDSVFRYEETWKKFVPRSGRWVDMDHPYKTMDSSYTESVWWSFKTLFEKKLVYQGFRVMPYCPHCGTTLSNFEVNQGYKDVSDISVYVKFKVKGEVNTYLLAWTTTPWTLPGNVALAVGEKIEYVKIKKENENFILAKEKLDIIEGEYELLEEFKGKKLVGLEYDPIFDYYSKDENLKNRENTWKVYAGDFVNTEEGTGIVHIAPAFGSDDYELSEKEKLPFIQHVDMEGKMKTEVIGFEGMTVKPKSSEEKERLATDIAIIRFLQEKGSFFDKKKITHSYPHCWRCDTPLLNYATSSWFVKVTDLKERMVKLNNKINWIPKEIGENRFGKWLEGARDWAVSRSRFWGAPLPVWQNDQGENLVLGSIDELKQRTKKSGNKYFTIRHGESLKNIQEVINFHLENIFPLTEKGREQVEESASTLKKEKIDLIISSPLERCKQTAEIARKTLNIEEEIIFDDRLWEIKSGDEYEGKKDGANIELYSYPMERFEKAPVGGETFVELNKRVGEFLYEIEDKYKDKNILIVTHAAPVSFMKAISRGVSRGELLNIRDKEESSEGYAFINKIDFTPLPHNENYELDLHKPYIDEVELVDREGNKLTRVKEVFDTWYDSGSMPYASVHYPFENKEEFDKKENAFFPADFIAEGLDQTRGWFYTLLVLGTGLFDKSPFENVIVNGIVLAEDGQKMSKRLKNYPDPYYILDKFGADAMRYYLLSSSAMRAEDLAFSEKSLDEMNKKLILRLENVLSFYSLYRDKDRDTKQEAKKTSNNILDEWLVARLNETGKQITDSLDSYELDKAARPILDFIDDFSTWYLKGSRDRFKSENTQEREMALSTIRYVLLELSKYMAPFTPFFSEYVYQKVKGENGLESVHLESWPEFKNRDEDLLNDMEEVRNIVSTLLRMRQEINQPVRQPLTSVTIPVSLKKEFLDIVINTVNVKEVKVGEYGIDSIITSELKNEGEVREFIRAVQELRKEKALTPTQEITLQIETSEEGKMFIESNKAEISKPTNISDFDFSANSSKEIEISNIKFKISIK